MTHEIHTGDAFDVLPTLDADSVHAVVTDPPYGLAFMGRDWDDFEPREYQEWCEEWAREVKRVLKPGGHLLGFSGNRTHHRLFTGVEDAGCEIRDTITYHYGSGFPKALDVSKAIDKQAGAEREVVGEKTAPDGVPLKDRVSHSGEEYDDDSADYGTCKRDVYERAPATDAAERWDGFKTALKPATEYVVLARKPLSEGTVAENVQTHGTGALNIDGTRIENEIDEVTTTARTSERNQNAYGEAEQSDIASASPEGRYPSNVVFDATEAERLDAEVGESGGGKKRLNSDVKNGERSDIEGYERENGQIIEDDDPDMIRQYGDSGGPSRYFYTSKASKSERTMNGTITNDHPTVKPVDLIEWIVTLATARGQTVLDPFAGSGTTGVACKNTDRRFVGIERQSEYADIARVRCGLDPDDPSVVRDDDAQRGIEEWSE